MNNAVPAFLQPFLWSYDIKGLDIARDKQLIVKQLLDYGDARAVAWLRATYSTQEIQRAITLSASSDWSVKSLALWSQVFDTVPQKRGRFV
jgi:hypothetical protein